MNIPRIAEAELLSRLMRSGAVVIEGAKGVGKTHLAKQHARSVFDADGSLLDSLPMASWPEYALNGDTPRLIDEWQTRPELWNLVRREVDDRRGFGHFILTGSATPAHDVTRHSGAGRFSRLRMRPLTSFESGLSDGKVSTASLFLDASVDTRNVNTPFDDVVQQIMRGGWPGDVAFLPEIAVQRVIDYLEESTRVDIAQLDSTVKSRDPAKIAAVIQSLARSIGGPMANSTVVADLTMSSREIHPATVTNYIEALDRVMLLEAIPMWTVHLRSKARLQSKPKRYFVDPSLAVASLRADRRGLYADLNFLGQLFENMVMRDLLVYAQHNDAVVSCYRDNNGLEVDAILEKRGGGWIAIEIKMGEKYVSEAADTLTRFASIVDTRFKGEPSALMVITATGLQYERDDGVLVVPITSMGP